LISERCSQFGPNTRVAAWARSRAKSAASACRAGGSFASERMMTDATGSGTAVSRSGATLRWWWVSGWMAITRPNSGRLAKIS
jgi:hypothetical protein